MQVMHSPSGSYCHALQIACASGALPLQGRGGDELGAELTRTLERAVYAGPSGRGAPPTGNLSVLWPACVQGLPV